MTEFPVDRILERRIRNGEPQYFVKWEGYPESANSWLEASELRCDNLVHEFFEESEEWNALNIVKKVNQRYLVHWSNELQTLEQLRHLHPYETLMDDFKRRLNAGRKRTKETERIPKAPSPRCSPRLKRFVKSKDAQHVNSEPKDKTKPNETPVRPKKRSEKTVVRKCNNVKNTNETKEPKKRGRPPKSKTEKLILQKASPKKAVQLTKRGPGRPQKQNVQETSSSSEKKTEVPKTRGRPRKKAVKETSAPHVSAKIVPNSKQEQPDTRKRGRP